MTDSIILTIKRRIAATPGRVFDAWLDPAQARRFLFATPDGEMVACEIDARVGGAALIVERRAGGDARHRLRFLEIDRPKRLVFLFAADPAEEDEWTRVTIEIQPCDAGAELTLTHEMDPRWADYESRTRQGWTMIVKALARYLEDLGMTDKISFHELRFERLLDASVDVVWSYIVDPSLRSRWFMGGEVDPRPGGRIEMIMDHDKISDAPVPTPERYAPFIGNRWSEEVLAIEPPHMIAFGWEEGKAGKVTITLTDAGDGKTRLVLIHRGLRGEEDARNFGGGWHAHLAVLAKRLSGEAVPDFWAIHSASASRINVMLGAVQ